MPPIEQRTAVVTGATSGIGAAIARRLAGNGVAVVVAGRDTGRGWATVAAITDDGGRAVFVPHDLQDPDAPQKVVAAAAEAFGGVDILVNNAGDFAGGPFLDISTDTFDALVGINMRGTFFLTQAALPGMIERGWGRVISMSTNAAQMGVPGGSLYGATRAAVDQMTRAWAVEFGGTGVTFNAIAAGFIDTPLAHRKGPLDDADATHHVVSTIPVRRIGTPVDVAAAADYLASDDAGYVTGVTLRVDGGLVIA